MSENRISKYFIYAIGEIILVMAGIMLALYFDNLNTKKENNIKEEWYLINIVEDIEYQKDDLKDLKEDCEKGILIGKKILKDFYALQGFSKIDSLNERINSLMFANNFPNINNTYQELVSSGQQSLIENKDLSIDIIDYYLFCEDNYIDFINNNNNIFYKEVFKTMFNSTQISLSELDLESEEKGLLIYDENINLFLKNELKKPSEALKLLNAIKLKILILDNHLAMVDETLTAGKDLVKKIDSYLGLTTGMVNNYD